MQFMSRSASKSLISTALRGNSYEILQHGWQPRIGNLIRSGIVWRVQVWNVVRNVGSAPLSRLLDVGHLEDIRDSVTIKMDIATTVVVAMEMADSKASLFDLLHCREVQGMLVLLIEPMIFNNDLAELF